MKEKFCIRTCNIYIYYIFMDFTCFSSLNNETLLCFIESSLNWIVKQNLILVGDEVEKKLFNLDLLLLRDVCSFVILLKFKIRKRQLKITFGKLDWILIMGWMERSAVEHKFVYLNWVSYNSCIKLNMEHLN